MVSQTFWSTTKKCENKNLTFISIQLSEMHGMGRVKILCLHQARIITKFLSCSLEGFWGGIYLQQDNRVSIERSCEENIARKSFSSAQGSNMKNLFHHKTDRKFYQINHGVRSKKTNITTFKDLKAIH